MTLWHILAFFAGVAPIALWAALPLILGKV
jgi:hypothetical protein